MIYILRNSQQFGPYDENTLLTYVNSGQILIQDRARDSVTNEVTTVGKVLKRGGLKPCVAQSGGLMSQLRQIGKELIVPASSLRQHQWLQDKRLLMLSLVGLAPLAVMYAPVPKLLIFYAVSLYFACIWGLFFYYLFKTAQVSAWTTIKLFFITQIGIFIIFSGLQKLSIFDGVGDVGSLDRKIGDGSIEGILVKQFFLHIRLQSFLSFLEGFETCLCGTICQEVLAHLQQVFARCYLKFGY